MGRQDIGAQPNPGRVDRIHIPRDCRIELAHVREPLLVRHAVQMQLQPLRVPLPWLALLLTPTEEIAADLFRPWRAFETVAPRVALPVWLRFIEVEAVIFECVDPQLPDVVR